MSGVREVRVVAAVCELDRRCPPWPGRPGQQAERECITRPTALDRRLLSSSHTAPPRALRPHSPAEKLINTMQTGKEGPARGGGRGRRSGRDQQTVFTAVIVLPSAVSPDSSQKNAPLSP